MKIKEEAEKRRNEMHNIAASFPLPPIQLVFSLKD
jgi:hypothetical protein